jgi:Uncharacterised nucleotidyltransferase
VPSDRVVNCAGGCWPNHEQELMLKAALLTGDACFDAWSQWVASGTIDRMDFGSFRLLPQLYVNLRDQGFEHPLMSILKGSYRRAWYKNQMLFHQIEPVLKHLHAAGLEMMLLKGGALSLLHYRDFGLRPMQDFDILVPEERAGEAIGLFRELGWKTLTAVPRNFDASFRQYRHSVALTDGTDLQVDLHWHVLYLDCRPNCDRDFWTVSVPVTIHDLNLRALNPTDQLLHACVHGIGWNEIPPLRWIADATAIMRSSTIDWGRFLQQVEDRRIALPVRDALRYLVATLAAPVPNDVIDKLFAMSVCRDELLEYERIIFPLDLQSPLDTFRAVYYSHLRSSRGQGLFRRAIGFVRYLEHYWQLDGTAADLFRRAASWGRNRATIASKSTFRRTVAKEPALSHPHEQT